MADKARQMAKAEEQAREAMLEKLQQMKANYEAVASSKKATSGGLTGKAASISRVIMDSKKPHHALKVRYAEDEQGNRIPDPTNPNKDKRLGYWILWGSLVPVGHTDKVSEGVFRGYLTGKQGTSHEVAAAELLMLDELGEISLNL